MGATRVGYCLLGAHGEVLAAEGEHEPFYAASTIKLAVLAAVARAVDAGALDWQTPLPVRRTFGSPPFSVPPADQDQRLPAEGTPLTVQELATAMITWSSNEATNLLVEQVGLGAVAQVLADAGAEGCRMERLIGDRAATAAGRTNEVTPLGLARLLHAVVTGRLTSAASRDLMVGLLRAQEFRVITAPLRDGVDRGSKSGWVDGIDHDVAFIGGPGTDDALVLAVCTAGYPGREGRERVRQVAASVLPRKFLA